MCLAEDNVVQPDIIFIRKERLHIVTDKNVKGRPDVVVEILSETTQDKDRKLKRRIYERFGIPEYWIVDPREHTIELLTLKQDGLKTRKTFVEGMEFESERLKGFRLNVESVFKSDFLPNKEQP